MLQIFNKKDDKFLTEELLKQINAVLDALFKDVINYNQNSLSTAFVSPCLIDLLGLIRRIHTNIYSLQTLFMQHNMNYTDYREGIYNVLSFEFTFNEILNFMSPMQIISIYTINNINEFFETLHLLKDLNEKNEFDYRINNKNNIDHIAYN